MINYPMPIFQQINNYYEIIKQLKILEEKKNKYLKKDDNYYMI